MTQKINHAEVLSFLTLKIKNILQLEESMVDPHLNLFEVGLHSIAVVELAHAIESEYQIRIRVGELFEGSCLEKMASLIVNRTPRLQ